MAVGSGLVTLRLVLSNVEGLSKGGGEGQNNVPVKRKERRAGEQDGKRKACWQGYRSRSRSASPTPTKQKKKRVTFTISLRRSQLRSSGAMLTLSGSRDQPTRVSKVSLLLSGSTIKSASLSGPIIRNYNALRYVPHHTKPEFFVHCQWSVAKC